MANDEHSVIHIHCLGCETARILDGFGCPECHSCAFCGQKLEVDDQCACKQIEDLDAVAGFTQKHRIPEELVPREKRRMEIRKEIEAKYRLWCVVAIMGIWACGNFVKDVYFQDVSLWYWVAGSTMVVFLVAVGLHQLLRGIETWRLDLSHDSEEQLDNPDIR